MRIDGQCHCGAVTYQADIDPERVSICHCTDCQALTGSPYRVTVICADEQVRLTAGAPKIYGKRGDNGRIRFQHFAATVVPPCSRAARTAVLTIGASAGAAFASAAN